jgi:hypothetical protein
LFWLRLHSDAFGIPEISQTFYPFYKNAKYNNNLWEKCLSGSSKVHVAERKTTIHGLYSRKIAPTVSIIHKEIKDSIKISKSKLTLTLIDLGYTCQKIDDNRRVLARIFQSRHQLIFKPLKKGNTIHLLVIVTILWCGQKH